MNGAQIRKLASRLMKAEDGERYLVVGAEAGYAVGLDGADRHQHRVGHLRNNASELHPVQLFELAGTQRRLHASE